MSTEPRAPAIHPRCFIAPGAFVLGDVVIGELSSVWYNAVVRGDVEAIRIGNRTNVQDGCVLHADPGYPCTLEDDVTLGHGAIVHGARVEQGALIGMRAVVMNGAVIGRDSLVGVGAVVTERTVVPPRSLVLGVPGKVVRTFSNEEVERNRHAAEHYVARTRAQLGLASE